MRMIDIRVRSVGINDANGCRRLPSAHPAAAAAASAATATGVRGYTAAAARDDDGATGDRSLLLPRGLRAWV
jgi:hypothetical protein